MYWIAVGLAGVLVLMGGIFVAIGRHKVHRDEASRSWPVTDAIVTSSGEWWDTTRGVSNPQLRRGSTFHYTANGQTFEYRVSGYLGRGAPIPANTRLPVHYDPARPSEFEFDGTREPYRPIFEIVGAVCLLLSLPFWYLALRMFRAERRALRAA